jgi:hypothetical protein
VSDEEPNVSDKEGYQPGEAEVIFLCVGTILLIGSYEEPNFSTWVGAGCFVMAFGVAAVRRFGK